MGLLDRLREDPLVFKIVVALTAAVLVLVGVLAWKWWAEDAVTEADARAAQEVAVEFSVAFASYRWEDMTDVSAWVDELATDAAAERVREIRRSAVEWFEGDQFRSVAEVTEIHDVWIIPGERAVDVHLELEQTISNEETEIVDSTPLVISVIEVDGSWKVDAIERPPLRDAAS